MNPTDFSELFSKSKVILGEGAVIERLRRSDDFELDPHIVNSGFIYDLKKREAMASIFKQYLDIGRKFNLPLFLSTPTWRAGRERIAAAGLESRDVNGDNFRFLDELRRSYGEYASQVVISGLLSCRGDAYRPVEALSSAESKEFHSWQAERLAESGVDLLLAATLPALSEAKGLAQALAATGKPYIVSFVFRPEGVLLDGTPIKDAMSAIDASTNPKPLAYMANCTHTDIFKSALVNEINSSALARERVIGLFANTAALSPEELDDNESLIEEEPEKFGRSAAALQAEFGLKILGGCCGTDDRHIGNLAAKLKNINS